MGQIMRCSEAEKRGIIDLVERPACLSDPYIHSACGTRGAVPRRRPQAAERSNRPTSVHPTDGQQLSMSRGGAR